MSEEQADLDKQSKLENLKLEKQRWKNRRKMAWLALFSMMGVTGILIFAPIPDARLKVISEPITWFYFAMASVIGAYMGFTTWASKG